MIISTNNLNNIETKITNPQVEGVEFITTSVNESTGNYSINASYNDIISILNNGKLPVLKYYTTSNTISYDFIDAIREYEIITLYGERYTAEDASSNMLQWRNDD